MTDTRITFKYILTAKGVVLITWLIHELAHWAASELLGYDSIMRLNATGFINGKEVTEGHHQIVSAAGPIITILQGIIAFLVLKKHWSKTAYLFLFTAFYMRFLAGVLNYIQPNDEGRISLYFGIGLYTLSILVSGFLFFLVYQISKKYQLTKKFHLITYIIITILTSIVILTDQFFKFQIL